MLHIKKRLQSQSLRKSVLDAINFVAAYSGDEDKINNCPRRLTENIDREPKCTSCQSQNLENETLQKNMS